MPTLALNMISQGYGASALTQAGAGDPGEDATQLHAGKICGFARQSTGQT